jgi:chitin disaccharide deacetylase
MKRYLIVTADDFGLHEAVNEAVEEAARAGTLTAASLMVSAPAAADAVRRARALPRLRVGLHLTLADGRAELPPAAIPHLVDASGRFGRSENGRGGPRGLAHEGLRWFARPAVRRELAAEIRAQFGAFERTGLLLDHVDAHKHLHLHPTVAGLLLRIGRNFGLKAVRVPAEPAAALRRAFPNERKALPFFAPRVHRLRRRARRAGLVVNDHVFGLAWSGNMVEERILRLLPYLPDGVSELYVHPAAEATPALATAMPGYRAVEEFAALTSAALKARIAALGIGLTTYAALAGGDSGA